MMDIMIATYILVIFIFVDNLMTVIILKTYKEKYPYDDKWYERELNKTGRLIFKKYGIGVASFVLNITHSYVVFVLILYAMKILGFDVGFFIYAADGALFIVNKIHYNNYKYLEQLTNNIDNDNNKEESI